MKREKIFKEFLGKLSNLEKLVMSCPNNFCGACPYNCKNFESCSLRKRVRLLKEAWERINQASYWVPYAASYQPSSEGFVRAYRNVLTNQFMWGWELPHPYTEEFFNHSYCHYIGSKSDCDKALEDF